MSETLDMETLDMETLNSTTQNDPSKVAISLENLSEFKTKLEEACENKCNNKYVDKAEFEDALYETVESSVEYVDLGLPSGLLWATCNLGATKPEEYGLYFQWGDTKGYKTACVESASDGNENAHYFNWSKYKYCNGTKNSITKYCTDSSYGVVDDKKVLESEDDAVTVTFGNQWRMPTDEDFNELINNTDPGDGADKFGWIENYNGTGINGLFRKSKTNDNFIFFPASGNGNGGSINSVGQGGCCWSSSLSSSSYGRYLGFDAGGGGINFEVRCYGYPVRGVTTIEKSPKFATKKSVEEISERLEELEGKDNKIQFATTEEIDSLFN